MTITHKILRKSLLSTINLPSIHITNDNGKSLLSIIHSPHKNDNNPQNTRENFTFHN